MGKLIEICTSSYDHAPLTEFGKKYYKVRNSTNILCEECVGAFLKFSSKELTEEILDSVRNTDMHYIENILFPSRHTSIIIETNVDIPCYMKKIIGDFYHLKIIYLPIPEDVEVSKNGIISLYKKLATCELFIETQKLTEFNIYQEDVEVSLYNYIKEILITYLKNITRELSDTEVQEIMDSKSGGFSSGNCTSSCDNHLCSICGIPCSNDYYIIHNKIYCLDHAYAYVVSNAVEANLSDFLGLSNMKPPCDSSIYNIYDTPSWKRSVISKYINFYESINQDAGIIHVYITAK